MLVTPYNDKVLSPPGTGVEVQRFAMGWHGRAYYAYPAVLFLAVAIGGIFLAAKSGDPWNPGWYCGVVGLILDIPILRLAFGDGWRITTTERGFSAWPGISGSPIPWRRVGIRWEEVDSYRTGQSRGATTLVVRVKSNSRKKKAIQIDVTALVPPLDELQRTFKAATNLIDEDHLENWRLHQQELRSHIRITRHR